jgi:Fic family protein
MEIMFTQKYLDDLIVRMTYHSNAIENSTLTLNETISILLYNTSPNGKDLREIYEATNHAAAFNLMLDKIAQGEVLTHKTILDLHYVLMDKLSSDRGQFKQHENLIVGSDFTAASVLETPKLIVDWCYDLSNKMINTTLTLKEVSEILAQKHIEFERIHPFSDGNGRIGRLLINYSLLQLGYPPAIILREFKLEYFNYLSEQNVHGLTSMIYNQCQFEFERAPKFGVYFTENS